MSDNVVDFMAFIPLILFFLYNFIPQHSVERNPSNPSTILFSSNLSKSWGSYEMRANQMSTEINRLAPTYTSFHLTQPFLPSTTLNISNRNYNCISVKSIDPIMSKYCRTTLNASYVLDLVDAPVDQDHLPTLLNSPMHQMYQIFRQFLWINQTKSISTNTNTKYMDDNVDILLVASKKQQSIYQLVWPNIEIIVARHHHTNFHPQLVRDPECNKNANVVGMIGYTKDNINPSLLTNVQTILKQQDFTLQVIDQTGFNNIDGDINRKDVNVIDGGDRIGCPYLPIEDVPSLNRLKSLSTNGTTTGIVGQEVFHRLENTPSFGLLWPPMQHSKNVTRLFGLVKPVTRLLWWWSHATPVIFWCGFESYVDAAIQFEYVLKNGRLPCADRLEDLVEILIEMNKMKKEERMELIEKGLKAAKYHLPGVVAKDLVESLGKEMKE